MQSANKNNKYSLKNQNMKFTFLLFFTLFPLNFNLTETENFLIENNEVIWQKTFETKLSKEEIISQIKTTGEFENINTIQDKITANIIDLSIDFKGYGESEMSTPIYLSRSFVKAFFLCEFKENRYRITIKTMKFIQKYDDGFSNAKDITEIETYALSRKNTEFKTAFLKKPSKILDYTFSKLTDFKRNTQNNKW
jgi:hypothetical protein